ncbi:MAG: PorT family protein [Saprospiraceae bacterium]|nr:PorT family protein [Saprospiraceae bacterium]MDW8484167.1 outer membrane beta-barrel protein [Saprospiraceae bacterium]
MKKILFLLTLLVLLKPVGIQAQRQQEQVFRFGIHTSPTWSWMRTDDKFLEGTGLNWGLKMGVQGEYYFAANYALTGGLGLAFAHGGELLNGYPAAVLLPNTNVSDPLIDTLSKDARVHYSLRYVELPVSLRFRGGSGEDSPLRFYAEAPIFTLGFLSAANGNIRGNVPVRGEDENIKRDVTSLALSWGFGAGVEYELTQSLIAVGGIQFQQIFTDITTNKGSVLPPNATQWRREESRATANAITLRLGVFF